MVWGGGGGEGGEERKEDRDTQELDYTLYTCSVILGPLLSSLFSSPGHLYATFCVSLFVLSLTQITDTLSVCEC